MGAEDLFEETGSVCPPWCVSAHDDDARGARVHRGPLHATDVRARRLVDGDVRPADEQEHLSARLVSYSDEPTVWISVETRTSPPLEIALTDANRWVMALGATMVDEGARLR